MATGEFPGLLACGVISGAWLRCSVRAVLDIHQVLSALRPPSRLALLAADAASDSEK